MVINELMPVNKSFIADQDGQYKDWLELYNSATIPLDISGYYLSDSKKKLAKWKIPAGTIIDAKGFLVFWADKDTTETGLHTNFKLSSYGEKVYFLTPDVLIIDKVEYPPQSEDLSYQRIPDGSGNFEWKTPTFDSSNDI